MRFRVVSFTLILFGAAAVAGVGAQDRDFDISRLSDRGRKAYRTLEGAGVFRIGPVGYGATIPAEQTALQQLLEEPEAIEALQQLSRSTRPAGSLYGLFGLRIKGHLEAGENVKLSQPGAEPEERTAAPLVRVEVDDEAVLTQSGCTVMMEEKRTVWKRISTGVYDFYFRMATGRN